ncbi:MAG TPA: hypothetical protein VD908_08400 [Cytophagales bacterium]|nr:hypothetical protein [Cytophagales bacterium]
MQRITIIFFIATVFSCSTNQNKTTNYPVQPLQIDNGEEEGWGADIQLSIVEKSENDTVKIYKAISSFEGKELGLMIFVPKAKEGDKGFGQGITLKSIGSQSDNLLRVLSQLYKQKADSANRFIKSRSVNYVNLKEFAKSLTGQEGQWTGANEYKLFFEGIGDQEYAELYLNINADENWLELREKDEEYRPIVLNFLRQ